MTKEGLILKAAGINEATIEKEINKAISSLTPEEMSKLYETSIKEFKPETILKGKIVNVTKNHAIVDIGYKAEGLIPLIEFGSSEIRVGDEIDVLLENVEDDGGTIVISKNKADRLKGWERVMTSAKEGDPVKGRVLRKVKGGLMVDIGMPAFLPASQVDIRRLDDIGSLVNKEITAKIIKIDPKEMNIILSRRKYLEEERAVEREKLLKEIQESDIRTGVVKNIADFGAFIDLGGIDGLLHITDMNWRRISHPSEMLTLDQTIKIKILKIDRINNKITVGLKQLTPNPWETAVIKYPVNSRIKGKIVNIVPYGAFVEVEPGIEGLLHISEISWTKRINNPSEVLAIGDIIEAIILAINPEKQELSLGMKQLETNPWTQLQDKYPAGTRIQGRVKNITSYGAFIEIEEGIDGLLHLSDIAWLKTFAKPSEVIKKGDKIEAVVLSVDPEKKRVSLGLKQLTPNPWETIIPTKYPVGAVVTGKVTQVASLGTIVELEPGVIGVLTLPKKASSEKSDKLPALPKPDDSVKVEVVKTDPEEGKITLKLVE